MAMSLPSSSAGEAVASPSDVHGITTTESRNSRNTSGERMRITERCLCTHRTSGPAHAMPVRLTTTGATLPSIEDGWDEPDFATFGGGLTVEGQQYVPWESYADAARVIQVLHDDMRELQGAHIGCDAYWRGQECIPCERALGPLYDDGGDDALN